MDIPTFIVKMMRRGAKISLMRGIVPSQKRYCSKQLICVIQRFWLKMNPNLEQIAFWELTTNFGFHPA
jgi:hypothetical protein